MWKFLIVVYWLKSSSSGSTWKKNLSVCPCLSVGLRFRLSVCKSVCRSVSLCVCLSATHGKIKFGNLISHHTNFGIRMANVYRLTERGSIPVVLFVLSATIGISLWRLLTVFSGLKWFEESKQSAILRWYSLRLKQRCTLYSILVVADVMHIVLHRLCS